MRILIEDELKEIGIREKKKNRDNELEKEEEKWIKLIEREKDSERKEKWNNDFNRYQRKWMHISIDI